MTIAPWRLALQPATFNGAIFYVDIQGRSGGFRLVPHEFPKKNIPWTESMGRRIRHWTITGYLIYSPINMPDVFGARNALIAALDTPGTGTLVLPSGLENMNDEPPGAVMVDSYSVIERIERGGWCAIEMIFVEAGQTISSQPTTDTAGNSKAAAKDTMAAANNSTDFISRHYNVSGSGQSPGLGNFQAVPFASGNIAHQ